MLAAFGKHAAAFHEITLALIQARGMVFGMNQFDFYTVKAGSTKISDLTKAGVDRSKIERRANGVAVYGNRCFRRWYYVATLGFFELSQVSAADALAAEWRAKGVSATVNYHASE